MRDPELDRGCEQWLGSAPSRLLSHKGLLARVVGVEEVTAS